MNIIDALLSRKSIRNFTADPVPANTLRQILEAAMQSPSALNTQPWKITVAAGKALEYLSQANVDMLTSGASPHMDKVRYEGVYRQRQIDLAIQLFNAMGIARDDKVKRREWQERGLRFFNAPAAIIISIESELETTLAPLDIGIFCQSVCLAAMEYGLGTCIEDQGILYPDVVKRMLGIPDNQTPIMAIAIGYPDPQFPANLIDTPRQPLDHAARWHGFQD